MKAKPYLPYNKASITNAEIKAVVKVMESGWLTMGHRTIELEEKFSKYIGVKHSVAVNSCTAALQLALMAHGVGPGDEVLLPSLTFVATANVVVNVGAKPIFVDVNPDSLCIDVTDAERKITKKTKVIIPVHYGGQPADLDSLSSFSKKHKLIIIEDAAHAVDSEWRKKKIGNHGNTVCFSFYATKNLTTGEGGMLTTNDEKIANFVRRNRLHGISKDAWKRYQPGGKWQYDVLSVGLKCNLTDMQAAIGIEQLKKLPKFTKKRIELAKHYDKLLSKVEGVRIFPVAGPVINSRHLYVIEVIAMNRDKFIERMGDLGIGTSVHFIPIHSFTYYRENYKVSKNSLPVTDKTSANIVSLPLYPDMSKKDVARVAASIKEILSN